MEDIQDYSHIYIENKSGYNSIIEIQKLNFENWI